MSTNPRLVRYIGHDLKIPGGRMMKRLLIIGSTILALGVILPASADHKRDRDKRYYSTHKDRYELRSPRNYRHGYHRRHHRYYVGPRYYYNYYNYPRYSRYYRDRYYSPPPWVVTGFLLNEALRHDHRYCRDRDHRHDKRRDRDRRRYRRH